MASKNTTRQKPMLRGRKLSARPTFSDAGGADARAERVTEPEAEGFPEEGSDDRCGDRQYPGEGRVDAGAEGQEDGLAGHDEPDEHARLEQDCDADQHDPPDGWHGFDVLERSLDQLVHALFPASMTETLWPELWCPWGFCSVIISLHALHYVEKPGLSTKLC